MKPELQMAYAEYMARELDKRMMALCEDNAFTKHKQHWRTRVMDQPFFGHHKGSDKITIRLPNRYKS